MKFDWPLADHWCVCVGLQVALERPIGGRLKRERFE